MMPKLRVVEVSLDHPQQHLKAEQKRITAFEIAFLRSEAVMNGRWVAMPHED
tara:strand:- start:71 stop:226 length:156 start_codon:yes stop_codon:yes gene_type:complete